MSEINYYYIVCYWGDPMPSDEYLRTGTTDMRWLFHSIVSSCELAIFQYVADL